MTQSSAIVRPDYSHGRHIRGPAEASAPQSPPERKHPRLEPFPLSESPATSPNQIHRYTPESDPRQQRSSDRHNWTAVERSMSSSYRSAQLPFPLSRSVIAEADTSDHWRGRLSGDVAAFRGIHSHRPTGSILPDEYPWPTACSMRSNAARPPQPVGRRAPDLRLSTFQSLDYRNSRFETLSHVAVEFTPGALDSAGTSFPVKKSRCSPDRGLMDLSPGPANELTRRGLCTP